MAKRTTPTYEVGNVCYLLSGSCRMVVEKIDNDGKVHAVWQNYETKDIMRGYFEPVTLSKAQA